MVFKSATKAFINKAEMCLLTVQISAQICHKNQICAKMTFNSANSFFIVFKFAGTFS